MCNTLTTVKTLTVRLPEKLVAEIEAETRTRGLAKSDVVRDRLQEYRVRPHHKRTLTLADAAADVGRPVQTVCETGQPQDHPVLLNMPESEYLKGAILRVL